MTLPIVVDIETIPLESAMRAPYPREDRSPPQTYKKEEAIAEWYVRDEAQWKEKRAKQCALNPRLGRVLCAGYSEPDGHTEVDMAQNETIEVNALRCFWDRVEDARGQIITWNGWGFDVPFLLVRSVILGIQPTLPSDVIRGWLRRYQYSPHFDVRMALCTWDEKTEGTLSDWAQSFGIATSDPVDGSQVHDLYQAGQFDEIANHCRSDVQLTRQLYERVSRMFSEAA